MNYCTHASFWPLVPHGPARKPNFDQGSISRKLFSCHFQVFMQKISMQYHEFCILHFKLSPSNLDHFGPFLIVLFLVLLTSFRKTNLIFRKTKGCCLKRFSHLSCHFQVLMQKISKQYHEFWILWLFYKLKPRCLDSWKKVVTPLKKSKINA